MKAIDLKREDVFVDYLAKLKTVVTRYTVFITAWVHTGNYVTAEHAGLLKELGIAEDLSWEGVGKRSRSYIAILENGHVFYEAISEKAEQVYYRALYNGSDLDIASGTGWASSARVKIDGNNYRMGMRGLTIIVYDKIANALIDSVSFDTHLQQLTARHLWKLLGDTREKLDAIKTGGYSIPQYLYENNIRNIVIYSEPMYVEWVKAFAQMFQLFEKCKVSFAYEAPAPRVGMGVFEGVSIIGLADISSKEYDAIIVLAQDDKYIDSQLKRCAAQVYSIWKLVDLLIRIVINIRPIANLAMKFPGVSFVLHSGVHTSPDTLSDNERYVKQNGITRDVFVNGLKQGRFVASEEAYAKYGYTPSDVLQMSQIPDSYLDEKGVRVFANYQNDFVTCSGGYRVTTNQPEKFSKTIYCCGICSVFGVGVPDGMTTSSFLQKKLNDELKENNYIRVENRGVFIGNTLLEMYPIIHSLPLQDGDIVIMPVPAYIFLDSEYYGNNVFRVPHTVLKRPHDYGELRYDDGHLSPDGQRALADIVFAFMLELNLLNDAANPPREQPADAKDICDIRWAPLPLYGIPEWSNALYGSVQETEKPYHAELDAFKQSLIPYRENIGAIVMNCNPFTLGHRYLIHYAAERVKHLFIFVVEEDRSVFPFADRIMLVKQGTEDLRNVTVLPSGKFIISQLTFVDYFNKSEIQNRSIDPTFDVELFAKEIAPVLGINVRFAGEEPLDNVTKQYNDKMREILPKYDIAFEEIPRKENGGVPISASRVRKLMESRDFGAVELLVPVTTLKYLMSHCDRLFGS